MNLEKDEDGFFVEVDEESKEGLIRELSWEELAEKLQLGRDEIISFYVTEFSLQYKISLKGTGH